MTDYNSTNNPPHKSAGFPQDCTLCHTTQRQLDQRDVQPHHDRLHADRRAHQPAVRAVPREQQLQPDQRRLLDLPQTDYNSTNNPPHTAAGFPQDCSLCHNTTRLDRRHVQSLHHRLHADRRARHDRSARSATSTTTTASPAPPACNCHSDRLQRHQPIRRTRRRTSRRTARSATPPLNWTGATFNHTTTGFTLTGAHTTTAVRAVPRQQQLQPHQRGLLNCHQTDYNGTTNPPHMSAGFPQDCSICHTTTDWTGATFNHATTGFTLTGAHTTPAVRAVPRQQQLQSDQHRLLSTATSSDYNGTSQPAAQDRWLPQDCTLCHNTTATGLGAHVQPRHHGLHADRRARHHAVRAVPRQQQLQPDQRRLLQLPPDRLQRHQQSARIKAAGFPQDCSTCHTTTDWTAPRSITPPPASR